MPRLSLSLLMPALLAGIAFAQCNPVPPFQTITTAGNAQKGTMFNIVNTTGASATIASFDQCFNGAGTSNVEIYTKAGTWQGFESTAAAWTLVGSATGVVHVGAPVLDPVPIPINITVPGGATQAFYVTCTNVTTFNVAYTTGVNQINAVIGTDGLLQVTGGPGKAYPFAGSFGLPTAGRLWNGRVHYCINGNPATNTKLGLGCIRQFASFYELFPTPAAFDLAGSALTLVPSGGGYVVSAGGAFLPVGSVSAPTALALGDDAAIQVPFTVGSFAGPAGPWTGVNVISNGIIAENAGNTTVAAPSVVTTLAAPQTAFYSQADFDPAPPGAGAGTIWYEESASVITITWDGVASWNVPGSSNTFQFQLYPSGVVSMVWVAMATGGANGGVLVGYSPAGANLDPGSTDLSALGLGALVTTAADGPPAISLSATSRPVTGTNWNLQVDNLPVGSVLGVDVFGFADPGINDLFFLGMPGCGLRATLDVLNAYIPAGTQHLYSVAIPASPALVGISLFTTSAMFVVPAPNAFGAVTANGVRGTIGDV